jgi:riboflavin kinase / FMN adenylyltransferase
MIVHEGLKNIKFTNPVVTLGIFDGVHRGHRTLIDNLVTRAREEKGESVVITFFPHPRIILEKDHLNLALLTTMEEKKTLLENAGVDHLIILKFSKKFSNMQACDFLKKILVDRIGTKHLIIGYNHHFGFRGEGDFDTIKKCSEVVDFRVEQVQGFLAEERAISSSLIRQALLDGKLDYANNLLGYPYTLTGTVIRGKQIGRSIGYPTANIKPDDKYKLIPMNGVYAVEVNLHGKIYPGMMSIGSNPTVNTDSTIRSIEVYIMNFDEDLYGKTIKVIFRKRLRDEKKFRSIEQLAEQMNLDRQNTLRLLS